MPIFFKVKGCLSQILPHTGTHMRSQLWSWSAAGWLWGPWPSAAWWAWSWWGVLRGWYRALAQCLAHLDMQPRLTTSGGSWSRWPSQLLSSISGSTSQELSSESNRSRMNFLRLYHSYLQKWPFHTVQPNTEVTFSVPQSPYLVKLQAKIQSSHTGLLS